MEEHERSRRTLERHGLPVPEGVIARVRYVLGRDDWYVLLETDEWYWFDIRDREWKLLINGPMDM